MSGFGSPEGFSGITGTDGPSASALESLRASFQSEFAETTGGVSDTATSDATTTTDSSSSTITSQSTTFSTSTLPIGDSTATVSDSATGTAADSASSTTGEAPTVSEKDHCDGISCNSGLQAAVAVPVVVAVLLIAGLLFFCIRRRRRRGREAEVVSEKKQPPKKKWSRHLRVFSFDAELLMGGWRSSSNSIRSRQTGSVRAGDRDHGHTPSLHSVDEVAPPYRDAVTTIQRPSPLGVTAPTPDPFPRPSSTATAPPPYAAAFGHTSRQSNRPTSPRDPFADASPISPTEESPFNDPPEDEGANRSTMSRQSSMLRSINEDGASTLAGSDAGSIREAQLGRNLSVMSGGRTINNVRKADSN